MAERRLSLRSTFSQSIGDEVFVGRAEFESGKLPSEREVLEMMIWGIAPRVGSTQSSLPEVAKVVAEVLEEHWIWSNVYCKKPANIKSQLEKLYNEFKTHKKRGKAKMTAKWQAETFQPYLERLKRGLDISTYDDAYLAKMEAKYGVKMTEEDRLFRDDQISHTRKMYCQSFADKRWQATAARRQRDEQRMAKALERDAVDQAALFEKLALPDDDVEPEEAVESPLDKDFDEKEHAESEEEDVNENVRKRRKTGENEERIKGLPDLPKNFQHIR